MPVVIRSATFQLLLFFGFFFTEDIIIVTIIILNFWCSLEPIFTGIQNTNNRQTQAYLELRQWRKEVVLLRSIIARHDARGT